MARLGEHLPRLLIDRGFEIVFGVPSVPTMEFYRGLDGSGLRIISLRNTTHAAFMADGYARACGAPAVCIASHGPGLTALAGPAAQALADSIPMLILSTSQPSLVDGQRGGHRHSMRDPAGLINSVCLSSHVVDDFELLAPTLDGVAAALHRGRRGPIHVEISEELLAKDAGPLADTVVAEPASLPPMKTPASTMIAEIVMRLSAANQPVLILGGGASGVDVDDIRALAERIGAATLMTSNARGLMPADHPLTIGGFLGSSTVKAVLAEADLVLAIGTEFSPEEWDLVPSEGLGIRAGTLIRVDIDPKRLHQNAVAALPVQCDASALLPLLLRSLPERSTPAPDHTELRQRADNQMTHMLQRHRALLEGIWAHLPEAVVVADPCEPTSAGLLCAMPPAPRRWLTAAAGFGAAGHALPAAVGAKMADPRRPVIALMGDAAVMETLGALVTAVETNAHIVVLVWNTTGMGEVRDAMAQAHIKPKGVDLTSVDLQPIARGLGAAYARVYSPDFLRDALRSAIMRPGPTVLELREDYWFG